MEYTVYLCIAGLVLLAIVIGIAIREFISRFCPDCGTKMDSFYDPEEDAEVYQCPVCGRSYIIK